MSIEEPEESPLSAPLPGSLAIIPTSGGPQAIEEIRDRYTKKKFASDKLGAFFIAFVVFVVIIVVVLYYYNVYSNPEEVHANEEQNMHDESQQKLQW